VFSGVITVATFVYVILTRQLAAETRAMRRAASEPLVSIYLEMMRMHQCAQFRVYGRRH